MENAMLISRGGWFRLSFDVWMPARLLMERLAGMRQAVIGRRALAQMDARMLADIGLCRASASEQTDRRRWDVRPIAFLTLPVDEPVFEYLTSIRHSQIKRVPAGRESLAWTTFRDVKL